MTPSSDFTIPLVNAGAPGESLRGPTVPSVRIPMESWEMRSGVPGICTRSSSESNRNLL